jgi:hypothetical protein
VQSAELQKFNRTPSKQLKSPFEKCAGTAAVFDLQISEFNDFQPIAQPFVAFRFIS